MSRGKGRWWSSSCWTSHRTRIMMIESYVDDDHDDNDDDRVVYALANYEAVLFGKGGTNQQGILSIIFENPEAALHTLSSNWLKRTSAKRLRFRCLLISMFHLVEYLFQFDVQVNFARRSVCRRCESPAPEGARPSGPKKGSGIKPGDWTCGECHQVL